MMASPSFLSSSHTRAALVALAGLHGAALPLRGNLSPRSKEMTNTIETVATEQSAQDGQTVFVPLNKLKKSPKNVRKVPHTDEFIAALAASVAAKGLYQNLVVEPEVKNGKPTGCYLVTAGEGRRLAYLLRAARGGPLRAWVRLYFCSGYKL